MAGVNVDSLHGPHTQAREVMRKRNARAGTQNGAPEWKEKNEWLVGWLINLCTGGVSHGERVEEGNCVFPLNPPHERKRSGPPVTLSVLQHMSVLFISWGLTDHQRAHMAGVSAQTKPAKRWLAQCQMTLAACASCSAAAWKITLGKGIHSCASCR